MHDERRHRPRRTGSSGPSSSQPARRRGADLALAAAEKSGARKGLASWRDTTDWGTTWRSPRPGLGDGARLELLRHGSMPAALSMSRLRVWPRSETTASSASSASSEVSRAAVCCEDRGDPVEALELLGALGAGLRLVRLDPGALLTHEQRDDLELGAHDGITAPLDGGLDLADGRASTGMMPSLSRGGVAAGCACVRRCDAGLLEPRTPPRSDRSFPGSGTEPGTAPAAGRGTSEQPRLEMSRGASWSSGSARDRRVGRVQPRWHRQRTACWALVTPRANVWNGLRSGQTDRQVAARDLTRWHEQSRRRLAAGGCGDVQRGE
jgi:hypothetical protein